MISDDGRIGSPPCSLNGSRGEGRPPPHGRNRPESLRQFKFERQKIPHGGNSSLFDCEVAPARRRTYGDTRGRHVHRCGEFAVGGEESYRSYRPRRAAADRMGLDAEPCRARSTSRRSAPSPSFLPSRRCSASASGEREYLQGHGGKHPRASQLRRPHRRRAR